MMKKWFDFIKENKKKVINYSFFLVTIFFLIGYSYYTYDEYVDKVAMKKVPVSSINYLEQEAEKLEGFKKDDLICQEFVGDYKGISSIRIKANVKSESNAFEIKLVERDSSKIIEKWKISEKDINDDSIIELKLNNEISDADGIIYNIEISAIEENTGNVYISLNDIYARGVCYYNGNAQTGDLIFEIVPVEANYSFVRIEFVIVIACMLICFGLIYYTVKKNQSIKVESCFLIFMLLFGTVYLFVLPPFSAPDEPRHYATAYYTSNKLLGVENDDTQYVTCRQCDSNEELGTYPSLETYRVVVSNIAKRPVNIENNSKFILGTIIQEATFFAHLPQAIGISIARIAGLDYICTIYMGQFFSLLFYVILVYFAIKIIPIGKYIMFALSGLPMLLQEAASCSYDIIIMGMVYYFIAFVVYLIYGDKLVKKSDILIMVIFSILFSPCKLVYCIVTFLVILIPKNKFSSRIHNAIVKVGVPLSGMLIAFVHNMGTVAGTAGENNYILWANEEGFTIEYLIQHIPYTLKLFVATYHEKFAFYVESLIGGSLGWFDIDIPVDLTIFSIILLILAINSDEKKLTVLWKHKIIYMGIFVIVSLLICASMLLGWTPLSYKAIEGVQGRYLLPVVPLFLLCFCDEKKNDKVRQEVVILGTVLVNYLVVLRIFETVIMR